MIRTILVLCAIAALTTAEHADVVPMGYTRIGADGRPEGVCVALTRDAFAALLAAAKPNAEPADGPDLAVGPGTWTGAWSSGRWTFDGAVPVAAPGAAWAELRLPVPGTVTAVRLRPLGEGPAPATPAWRMAGPLLVLALPPQTWARLELTVVAAAQPGVAASFAFPPGGTVQLAIADGLVASCGEQTTLPLAAEPLSITLDRPAAAIDSGSLGLSQDLTLRHLGDRIAWTATIAIDSQRQPPALVELILPPRLDVLSVTGAGLAGWRQRDGRLELRWSATARERARHAVLGGVITGDGPVAATLTLPGAVRGSGQLAVADAGPVRWTIPEGVAGLRRTEPAAGERFRLAWDGLAPDLTLAYAAAAGQLGAALDGLLVVGDGRWRAEFAITLGGSGLADHVRVTMPAAWRVVASEGAEWLPGTDGSGVLRGDKALTAGTRLVLRCESISVAGLPQINLTGPGITTDRVRWLVADRGDRRATLNGPATDADALAADLARAGIRPRPDERARNAAELRQGTAVTLAVGVAERRQRIEAAHYLVAAAGAVRWACRLTVQPEQGALDQVRVHIPPGARLADRRGEAVAAWTEADGWLTARFAAPLDRPTSLDLAFTVDWAEVGGRERVELGAIACEPAIDRETVALAEDEEAGQLVRRPEGLDERPATAVALPGGVVPALLTGRTWQANGTTWKLGLEREHLDQGIGADAVATQVDAHSAIDPDRRLVSRATWYVINRSRSALDLVLPAGCTVWEVRVGGQVVRVRQGVDATHVSVPVTPLRPGEAAMRIQVCWAQQAGDGLRPLMPVFPELRVMRALWRFTAPPGTSLRHVEGWEPVPAGDATGARVEVLADELKRLRSSSEESPAVRARLADQLRLIDQELTDHVAVLELLGQDPERWTGDVAVRQADMQQQQEYQQRNSSFNSVANDNRQAVREKLGKLTVAARQQRDRRGGLLLDALAVRWSERVADGTVGPEWAPRQLPLTATGATMVADAGTGLGAGQGLHGVAATTALTGVDLLPDQAGDELTLRADSLAARPVLAIARVDSGNDWALWLLSGLAALAAGVALSRRSQSPRR